LKEKSKAMKQSIHSEVTKKRKNIEKQLEDLQSEDREAADLQKEQLALVQAEERQFKQAMLIQFGLMQQTLLDINQTLKQVRKL